MKLTKLIAQRLADGGRYYGDNIVTEDGRPAFAVGRPAKAFQQPCMGEFDIWVQEYLYVRTATGITAMRSATYFNMHKQVRPVGRKDHRLNPDTMSGDFPAWVKCPATSVNLKRLLALPMIDEETQRIAADLLYYWEYKLPTLAFFSILLKAGAQPTDGVGRLPAIYKRRIVKKDRKLTQSELMAAAMGVPIDRTEEVEVEQYEIFEEAQVFQQYCSHYTLYSQQLIGAWAIWELRKIPLWYDMRVGKTWSAIAALKRALAEGLVTHGLVVCPTFNMFDPWVDELQKGGLNVRVLDGSQDEDWEALAEHEDYDVYIINYERLKSRTPFIEEHLLLEEVFIIADETSAIKNYESQRAAAMHYICRRPEFVVLLNGTPCEQGPHDLWSQMKCIDPYGVKWGSTFYDHYEQWLYQYAPGKFKAKNDLDFQVFVSRNSIRYIRSEADQFAGRDKTFRYVEIPPTEQQVAQSTNVLNGFLETVGKDGEAKKTGIHDMYLVIAGFLREIACSYDKYREVEDGPYIRVRHSIDPKLLWVLSFLMSKPGEPVVIYCEFNEQESRLKEMLDDHGIKWSSTRPRMKRQRNRRIVERVPWLDFSEVVKNHPDFFQLQGAPLPAPGATEITLPAWVRYSKRMIEESGLPTESYYQWKDTGTHSPQEKSRQVSLFNTGETQVFICKWSQARGFSLSRKEAVKAGRGTYPTIISLCPTWSLGAWKQGQDRCVTTHDGKNVNTMIYALTTKGSIEKDIMNALRGKEEIATALFQDAKRKGFESFVSNMIEDMRTAQREAGVFDAFEMDARIKLGVPPFSKLTKSLIDGKAGAKIKVKKTKVAAHMAKLGEDDVMRKAYDKLMEKVR